MTNYIENFCPNPSFETDLTGYTALTGTELAQDTTQGFSGHNSMMAVTDGSVSGEGFTGPSITIPSGLGTSGAISFYLMGETGTLTISAVSGTTATIIAQTSVTLAGGDYQRVVLSGLALTAGQQLYFLVQTATAQALTFWVDAVQYEMAAAPSPYIDGSFPHCAWTGTVNESASYQQFQFPTSASGGMYLEGRATPVSEGETFTITAEGSMTLSGTESGTTVISPVGAMSDFGIWTAADFDPAVSYIGWSNAGEASGAAAWNRVYALAYPPQTTYGSGGAVLWKRAAYGAVGFDFKAVPSNEQQSLACVQFERMPVNPGTSPVPTAYDPPRQVETIVKPTRLNYCPNPSIEVSTAGWTVVGSAVLTKDSTTAAAGSSSLKVAVHAASDGAYIMIPDLILGDTYVVSVAVQGGPGLEDVIMAIAGVSTSSSQQGVPYGGDAIDDIGFGQGPYGGIQATGSDMPVGQWFGPSLVFTATASTVCLSFQSLVGSDVSYPTEFWVDAVLVEEGETVNPYFDGGEIGPNPVPDLWYMSNVLYISDMDAADHASTAALFNNASSFGISTSPSTPGIPAGYSCTPALKYTSYAQLQSDITGGAITGGYQWLIYDTEDWNNTSVEPQAEVDNPWVYMADFVTLAHAHGYKVILTPGLDLGNDPTSVNPKLTGETNSAWFTRTNVIGAAAATGAEIVHVQAQSLTALGTYNTFFASCLAQFEASKTSGTQQISTGISTSYGTPPEQLAAVQAATGAQGVWLNATVATISAATQYEDLAVAAIPPPAAPVISDYSWETGGTGGLTRSYYYERYEVASGAVTAALAEHVPLGIVAATPVYSQTYTQ